MRMLTVLMVVIYVVGDVEGGASMQPKIMHADWSNAC